MTPEERARKSADAMWAKDDASKWAGMEIADIGPGRAALTLTVEARHANGHGICHGGVIFMLADSAFAFACNSYNRLAVAQHNMISFIAPGRVGDALVAEAREVSLRGRSGIYDVAVLRGGEAIAQMRGCSRVVDGTHFEEENVNA